MTSGTIEHIKRNKLPIVGLQGAMSRNPWGRTLFVDSTHAKKSDATNNNGLNMDRPLATFVRANALARPLDTIILNEGHNENIAAATVVADAGLKIIGYGDGNRRAKLTFATSTAANLSLTGAGIRLENIQLTTSIDALVRMIDILGADCVLDDLLINESGGAAMALTAIRIAAARARILRLTALQPTAGANACIFPSAGHSNWVIEDCDIRGDYLLGAIHTVPGGGETQSTAQTNIKINKCKIENSHTFTTTTGVAITLTPSAGAISGQLTDIDTFVDCNDTVDAVIGAGCDYDRVTQTNLAAGNEKGRTLKAEAA